MKSLGSLNPFQIDRLFSTFLLIETKKMRINDVTKDEKS